MPSSSLPFPIRVVHSHPVWLPQTQTWMYTQVRHLPTGVESHVVCERTEHMDQFGLPRIHSLSECSLCRRLLERGARKIGLRRHLGLIVDVARRVGAPILHSHFGTAAWFNLGVARKVSLKHIATCYGSDISQMPDSSPVWKGRYLELFAAIDLVLCEGPHMARCAAGLGCSVEKIRVHHLGVELDRIPFQARHWDGGEPFRILIAASFREKKGIPFALEAIARLPSSLRVETTIIGDAAPEESSQREKQRILAAADCAQLRGRVRFLGFQAREVLARIAYEHHIFLSPSVTAADGDTEGGVPVSIIEMAASGMPVVSTRHCDIPAVITHGVSGLLAAERDVDGLAAHLLWLAEHPGQWTELGRAARQHIEAEYDAVRQGELLAGIYADVLRQ